MVPTSAELSYSLAEKELERQVARVRDTRAAIVPLVTVVTALSALLGPAAVQRLSDDDPGLLRWVAAGMAVAGAVGALIAIAVALAPREDFFEAVNAQEAYVDLNQQAGEGDALLLRLIDIHVELHDSNSVAVNKITGAALYAAGFTATAVVGLVLSATLPLTL